MKILLTLLTVANLTLCLKTPAAEITQHPSLTLDGARKAVDAAVAAATSGSAPGAAIAVVDEGGHLLHFVRLDGTFPASPAVSIGKAKTAAVFRKATGDFEKIVNQGRFAMTALPPDFTPLQGGVPIQVDGRVVGAIGVSGAKSAAQDEEIAKAGAAAVEGARMAAR